MTGRKIFVTGYGLCTPPLKVSDSVELEEINSVLLSRAQMQKQPDYMPLTPLDGPFSDLVFAVGAAELAVEGDWEKIFELNLAKISKYLQTVPISAPGLVGGVAGLNCMVSAAADLFDESISELIPIMHEKVISDSVSKIDSVRTGDNLKISDYDYVEGIVGIGCYLDILGKAPSEAFEKEKKQAEREIVSALTSHIIKFESDAFYIYGSNIPEHYTGADTRRYSLLDFGFAHGILGVYWYLSRKLHIDSRVAKALTVLELQMTDIFPRESVDKISPFLLRHGRFSSLAPVGVNGWCYGYPGMALADSALGLLKEQSCLQSGEPFSFDLDSGLGICHGLSGQLLIWSTLRHSLSEQLQRTHRRRVECAVSNLNGLFEPTVSSLNESFGFWNGVLGSILVTLHLESSSRARNVVSPLKLFGLGVYA